MKKITICISGGIAAYKVTSLISYLKKYNVEINVIMSENATKFITPLTIETISKNKVYTNDFENTYQAINHIELAQTPDLIVIVPATANVIGKISNGIADDLLTSTILASNKKVLIVPAMNTVMYENKIVQDNIKKLKKYGYEVMEPIRKKLACGTEGVGALPEIETITNKINELINFKEENK